MLKNLFLQSICIYFAFCAVHDQAQEVMRDVSHVPQATIKDMSTATESAPRTLATEFELITGTFPTANVQCRDGGNTRTFTVQYIKDSVTQAGNCWADGTSYPCNTTGSQYYPKKFNNGDNLQWGADKEYCTNPDNTDFMQEFPVKLDGTVYNGGNNNGIWRVIYKKTRIYGGKRELRYCGIAYHSDATHFSLCIPP